MKLSKIPTLLRTIQTGQFQYFFPHYYYLWKRSIEIESTPPMSVSSYGTPGITEVHMLTGAKHHVDLLYAAKSFILHYGSPISLLIHADNSVTEPIVKKIKRHLPGAKVLTRQERDSLVEPELERRGLMRCLNFRRLNVLAAKIIDVFLLSKADRVILLDTDCLAFSSFDRLRQVANRPTPINTFGKDPQKYPYSISEKEMRESFGIEVKPHVNTGCALIARSSMDLDVLETWLSKVSEFPMKCHFAEQTVIAALASRGDVELLPEKEYNMGRSEAEETCNLIHYCGHYLSKTRIAMRSVGQSMVLNQLRAYGQQG